jgi:diacylglycerol kinase (ATP)
MREALRKHQISFKNAFAGLLWALETQPNFRVHFIISLAVIILGFYYRLSLGEMTIIIFTILLGLTAEMINTSIEAMTDLITKEWRIEAKIAKDVSAGMMLLVAIGAVFIAFLIFFPHISQGLI